MRSHLPATMPAMLRSRPGRLTRWSARVLPALLLAAACGKGGQPSQSTPTAPTPAVRSQDAAPIQDAPAAVVAPPAPPADVVIARDQLPPGAVARIGGPSLSAPEAIGQIIPSAQGDRILVCGNHTARLWDRAPRSLLWHSTGVHDGVRCGLSPDGRYVAMVDDLRQIVITDWKAGTSTTQNPASGSRVLGFAFSPDGARIAIQTGYVTVQNVGSPETVASVAGVALTARFVAGGLVWVGDDKVQRWSGSATDKAATLVAKLPGRAVEAALSADGTKAAWWTGKALGLVDVATGAVAPLTIAPGDKQVQLALSPAGDLLAVATSKVLTVWEVGTGAKLWETPTKYLGAPAFSGDGRRLFFTTIRDVLEADARTGAFEPRPPAVVFQGWTDGGDVVVKRGDETWAVSLATGQRLPSYTAAPEPPELVKVETAPSPAVVNAAGKRLFALKLGDQEIGAWAASADGKRLLLALGGELSAERQDGTAAPRVGTTLQLRSVPDRKVLATVEVDAAEASALALDADGSHAWIGWTDGSVETAAAADLATRTKIGGHLSRVVQFSFSPDGKVVAISDADATTIVRPGL